MMAGFGFMVGVGYKDGCGIWSMSDSCTVPGGERLAVPFVKCGGQCLSWPLLQQDKFKMKQPLKVCLNSATKLDVFVVNIHIPE
jgi:hypothetical protein